MSDEEYEKDIDDYNDNLHAGEIVIHIPQCCSEGREDCKHAVQKDRPVRRNIGV